MNLSKLLGFKLRKGKRNFNNRKFTKQRSKQRQIINLKNGKTKIIIHEID